MKSVTLARSSGEAKEVNVYFSLEFFFLGPLYWLYKGIILRGILLTLGYVVVLWKGFFGLIQKLLVSWGVNEASLSFLDTLDGLYIYLLIGLAVLHILLAFITPRVIIKKHRKDGYVPYCEIDTQIMIKHKLAKVGTQCYLASFKAIDGVQGKIKMGNSKELAKELDELKQLLKDGMLTKDEYETKRAQAIMRCGSKNNKEKRG